MKRKKQNPDNRYIYRNQTDCSWVVKIPVPNKFLHLYSYRRSINISVNDGLVGKEMSLNTAKRIRDEELAKLKFVIPMDINDGKVRSRTATGVVGVSYVWKGDKVIGFKTDHRNNSFASFVFTTMSKEMAWKNAVRHRYNCEGRDKDCAIPPMPDISKAYKLNRGPYAKRNKEQERIVGNIHHV